MDRIILIAQLAATLFMTGVIWLTQLVQYTQFADFRGENFTNYHDNYRFWITPVVAPAMIVELFSAILLIFYKPAALDSKLVYAGLLLVLVIWTSTFFLQVPLHEKLAGGFDADAHRLLVGTNWIRTVAWSLRAVLILYFAWVSIRP